MMAVGKPEKRAATTLISIINFSCNDLKFFRTPSTLMVFVFLNLSGPIQVSDRMGQRVSLF